MHHTNRDASTPSSPNPFTYLPSKDFDGNDGHWSSFSIRVGTSAQTFRVLPSLTTSEVLVPLDDGCESSADATCSLRLYDQKGLYNKRGLFINESSTWHGIVDKSSNMDQINVRDADLRPDLGDFDAKVLYGRDNLELVTYNGGVANCREELVGGYLNDNVYVGLLGLAMRTSHHWSDNTPQSLLSHLVRDKVAPSMSWGYTAGAYYKTPKAYASLTIGGYNQARFVPHNLTIPFQSTTSIRPLKLAIQSISYTDTVIRRGSSLELLSDHIYVEIDFTVPHLWLPIGICDEFAAAFSLQYDSAKNFYMVNDTTRARLQRINPNVTFGLARTPNDPAGSVQITLPYSAFDLQIGWPWYNDTVNYFPIRRAYNESQYTIGRAFMQEAYLIADYEREVFSVHQALFPDTDQQEIVTILPPEPETNKSDQRALSKGGIAGISIAAVVVSFLAIAFILWYLYRRKHSKRKLPQEPIVVPNEIQGESKFECDGQGFVEMDGVGICELSANNNAQETDSDSLYSRSYRKSGSIWESDVR